MTKWFFVVSSICFVASMVLSFVSTNFAVFFLSFGILLGLWYLVGVIDEN